MVTWQTYQQVIKGMQADAADKVAALIFGSTTARACVQGPVPEVRQPHGPILRHTPWASWFSDVDGAPALLLR